VFNMINARPFRAGPAGLEHDFHIGLWCAKNGFNPTVTCVSNPTLQSKSERLVAHPGAETNTLDTTGNENMRGSFVRRRHASGS